MIILVSERLGVTILPANSLSARKRMGPGGSRGLQLRWRVLALAVGSTPTPSAIEGIVTESKLRSLPSVDQILSSGQLVAEVNELSRPLVTTVVREVLSDARKAHKQSKVAPTLEEIIAAAKSRCSLLSRRRITRVLNGTGVLIHTNLGRAPLGRELLDRVTERVRGYSTLEFDLESGKRGQRGSFLAYLLAQLTGAGSAIAVNNNAAALFLILNTFANKREVLVSRSELVQIGGGFRIPDIIRRAGAKLVEVGTTNQTTVRDYREAITDKTTMILKVHRSNFHLEGFVDEVPAEKLAELAAKKKLISVYDVGSGAYHQTEKFGMEAEPNITTALRSRSTLVCFSADKLLGSTQAGIVIGDEQHTAELHANPIYRTLRLDKVTMALLEECALAYLRKEDATLLPLWRQIRTPVSELRARADAISQDLSRRGVKISVRESQATPGGGSLPGGAIDSIALVLSPTVKPNELTRILLDANPPLVGYIDKQQFYIDLRTIDPSEDRELIAILTNIASCLQ